MLGAQQSQFVDEVEQGFQHERAVRVAGGEFLPQRSREGRPHALHRVNTLNIFVVWRRVYTCIIQLILPSSNINLHALNAFQISGITMSVLYLGK